VELRKESPVWGKVTQPIGKSQLYVLLVDADGEPVLDASGAQQVVALESTNGRMQVDATATLAKKVSSIIGEFAVSTTAIPKAINGKSCTVNVLSGAAWINPDAVAVAGATAIKLTGALELRVQENLSLISDATGASVQIIVWED